MFHLLQTNFFKESNYDLLVNWLQRNNVGYEIIRFVPYVHDIEFTTKRKDVWCWGSVSMSRAAKKYDWTPGSMYNENHDFEVYAKHYGENMLNHDGVIIKIEDPLPENYHAFFARPTRDTKAFSGKVFMDYSWYEWIDEQMKSEEENNMFTPDMKVLVAPLKNIQQEVRCWVVNKKVVTASRYRLGGSILRGIQNYDHETFFIDFAQKMVDIYCPAEAFVIDVCLTNDELKVVEINCVNAAGYYDANMNKLCESLENHFS